jgi:hypothetical protein
MGGERAPDGSRRAKPRAQTAVVARRFQTLTLRAAARLGDAVEWCVDDAK